MEISRNPLAGALGALGKLVCRTSPVEAYRSVLIEGKENKISFRTAGNDETVTFTVDCEDAGEFRVIVNFDAFRTAVKAGKNKTVVLDPDAGVSACGQHSADGGSCGVARNRRFGR